MTHFCQDFYITNYRGIFSIEISFLFQKRKTLRASSTAQRRIKSNGVNEPSTISSNLFDKFNRIGQFYGPERAWPGDSDIRQRRLDDMTGGGMQNVPRYLPAYTQDVSHLIV